MIKIKLNKNKPFYLSIKYIWRRALIGGTTQIELEFRNVVF